MKRVIKTVFKVLGILILLLMLAIAALDAYMIYQPQVAASKTIPEIEKYAMKVDDELLNRDVKVIGLGEATHGNKEFQELKLEVLQTLVRDNGVSAIGFEMDYGEGVLINDYINGYGDWGIDEVMDHIAFQIYHTEQIRALIEWMRTYNEESEDGKLSFYGYDLQNPESSLIAIRRFLTENHILDDANVTDSFTAFINGEFRVRDEKMEQIYTDLLTIQTELEGNAAKYSDMRNYDRVLYCINNIFKTKDLAVAYQDSVAGGIMRDEEMAKNVLAISQEQQYPILITGHNGHVGYAGSYVTTMGSHLKDYLGDDYYVIGTDYFKTKVNIASKNGRKNHTFNSADILAYQAKKLGTYYLRFSDVDEESPVYQYLHTPINTGSVGESFSVVNKLIPASVRIHCNADYLYDAMILVYKATPLELLD